LALISGNFSVHPHVRGDYAGAEDQGGPRPRSIPTCVGTTEAASNPIIALTVHPHVRGDYRLCLPSGDHQGGPSPRAWGLLLAVLSVARRVRSIPTCVGTTLGMAEGFSLWTVHPHVRGDYISRSSILHLHRGPSPRAWGLRKRCSGILSMNTVHPHVRGDYVPHVPEQQPCAVHPHVRGDYRTMRCSNAASFGPSPRAWGLHWQEGAVVGTLRSIPTCVGTTRSTVLEPSPMPVHPHVRGDYSYLEAEPCPLVGPSPRAWGLPPGNA